MRIAFMSDIHGVPSALDAALAAADALGYDRLEIGRASCRERVWLRV